MRIRGLVGRLASPSRAAWLLAAKQGRKRLLCLAQSRCPSKSRLGLSLCDGSLFTSRSSADALGCVDLHRRRGPADNRRMVVDPDVWRAEDGGRGPSVQCQSWGLCRSMAQCNVVVSGDGCTDKAWKIFRDTSDDGRSDFGPRAEPEHCLPSRPRQVPFSANVRNFDAYSLVVSLLWSTACSINFNFMIRVSAFSDSPKRVFIILENAGQVRSHSGA